MGKSEHDSVYKVISSSLSISRKSVPSDKNFLRNVWIQLRSTSTCQSRQDEDRWTCTRQEHRAEMRECHWEKNEEKIHARLPPQVSASSEAKIFRWRRETGAWKTQCQTKKTGKMRWRKTRRLHHRPTDVCKYWTHVDGPRAGRNRASSGLSTLKTVPTWKIEPTRGDNGVKVDSDQVVMGLYKSGWWDHNGGTSIQHSDDYKHKRRTLPKTVPMLFTDARLPGHITFPEVDDMTRFCVMSLTIVPVLETVLRSSARLRVWSQICRVQDRR